MRINWALGDEDGNDFVQDQDQADGRQNLSRQGRWQNAGKKQAAALPLHRVQHGRYQKYHQ
jgi:hypothetical protein